MSVLTDLAAGYTPDEAVSREIVRAAVQTAVTCSKTGVLLDARTTVVVNVRCDGVLQWSKTLHAAAYDEIAGRLARAVKGSGVTLEIIDGRVVFGKGGRRG